MNSNLRKLDLHSYKHYQMACDSECTILITGETGTGKTSLAREIHEKSSRKLKPFIAINLATLHDGLLESELFGHEKGSFTGAVSKRIGRLELAQGGTVFLDEIGDLTLRLQARLLEFLQSKVVIPVGSNQETYLDVRIIAATHKNLISAVSKKEFREDLFHRLRMISIHLKPLRESSHQLNELVHQLIGEFCIKFNKKVFKLSDEVVQKLESYYWPGNIRELRNALEYAVFSSTGTELVLSDLPEWVLTDYPIEAMEGVQSFPMVHKSQSEPFFGVAEVPMTLDFYETFARFEKEYIRRALSKHQGRINWTARQIGMNKTTLLRKMKGHGIQILKLDSFRVE